MEEQSERKQTHKRKNKQTKNPEVQTDSRMTEKAIKNTNERKPASERTSAILDKSLNDRVDASFLCKHMHLNDRFS